MQLLPVPERGRLAAIKWALTDDELRRQGKVPVRIKVNRAGLVKAVKGELIFWSALSHALVDDEPSLMVYYVSGGSMQIDHDIGKYLARRVEKLITDVLIAGTTKIWNGCQYPMPAKLAIVGDYKVLDTNPVKRCRLIIMVKDMGTGRPRAKFEVEVEVEVVRIGA